MCACIIYVSMHVNMYGGKNPCLYIFIYVCKHTGAYMCMYLSVCGEMCIVMYLCADEYMYVCVCQYEGRHA